MAQLRFAVITLLAAGILTAGTAFIQPNTGSDINQACGVFSLGTYNVDISKGETTAQIPSKDMLVQSMKSGLSFTGTASCPGSYEIVDANLTIDADKDAQYHYNYDVIKKMSSMETYMLTRYFVDAQQLHFTGIKVKGASGEMMDVPDVSFTVK